MIITREQFVVDAQGAKTAVLLEIGRYEELLEAQEEIDAIRAFDQAKNSADEAIPFSQAVTEIEAMRQ